ncbi:hypothetical protein F5Y16DRAFT_361546 [Xylariaceae sp. FL0255]|nr:hypothetical protein F5Y16DRAFT_361546 [Xylariaceae sp. FL0255]
MLFNILATIGLLVGRTLAAPEAVTITTQSLYGLCKFALLGRKSQYQIHTRIQAAVKDTQGQRCAQSQPSAMAPPQST